jgi:hypothetical protein
MMYLAEAARHYDGTDLYDYTSPNGGLHPAATETWRSNHQEGTASGRTGQTGCSLS